MIRPCLSTSYGINKQAHTDFSFRKYFLCLVEVKTTDILNEESLPLLCSLSKCIAAQVTCAMMLYT
jgi:hypothetical protein